MEGILYSSLEVCPLDENLTFHLERILNFAIQYLFFCACASESMRDQVIRSGKVPQAPN